MRVPWGAWLRLPSGWQDSSRQSVLTVPERDRTTATEWQPIAGSWPQLHADNGTRVGLRETAF